jgi:SanA protein
MILIGSVVLINLYIIEYAQVRIVQHPNDLSSTQWGMILGASVYADGSLSPALQQRVDLALELYDAQLISSFFVSGSDQEHYKEVAAMVHYLTGSGVPLDHIETDPG